MSRELTLTELELIVIGTSAGAVEVLLGILPALPADYPLPIVIVVHIPPNRESTLAALLNSRCQISVKEAEDKEALLPGFAYIAPPDYHLLIEPELLLSLSKDEIVHYSRPSIDVLFESAADAFGNAVAGIILTGANADGSQGLKAITSSGGVAIVQSPESAHAEAMPLAALQACPHAHQLTPVQIADALLLKFRRGSRS